MPGEVPTSPGYRGDPWSQVFQFVDQDTTAWELNAEVRRIPNSENVLAAMDIETNFEGDPELVRLSLDAEQTATFPPRVLAWDLQRVSDDRTLLKSSIDFDPDVTRVEVGS